MDSTHGFSYQNLDYHVNDFVYVSGDILFNIARIDSVVWRKGISQPEVTLQEFVRYNDHDEVSNLVPTEEVSHAIQLAAKSCVLTVCPPSGDLSCLPTSIR